MIRLLQTLRAAFVLAAFLSVTANGAQAHLGMSAPGSIFLPICGPAADQFIVLTVGEPVPVNVEGQTCCGDCMAFAAIVDLAPNTLAHYAPLVILIPAQPDLAYDPGAPVWPGAPPHGPPATSEL